MTKSYFLIYGANGVSVDELGELIANNLGMSFELHNSFYVGEYIKCIGSPADHLTIESDKEGDGSPKFEEEPFNNYAVIVEASNMNGSNANREERHNGLKEAFKLMPELVLLKETILEK